VKSVVLLTGSHLCHNPRAIKEATALAQAGFTVEILGAWLDPVLRKRDRDLLPGLPFKFTAVADLVEDRAARLSARVRTKAGRWAHRFLGRQNKWQTGYSVDALCAAAMARTADAYIAHSEAGLVAARRLSRAGRRVGVDLEDWFSEDLLPEARKGRPVQLLRKLEASLLRSSIYTSVPSRALSEAVAAEFACRAPTVIYNAFPWVGRERLDGERKDRKDGAVPTLHWYSQTLGPGRGLEDLFAALPHLKRPLHVHLRGRPVAGLTAWMDSQLPSPWRGRVHLHDLVGNDELLSRVAEHDIGFAGEMKFCRSRDLTVTNKILHYLLGGLAVVASDTAGQREVAHQAPGAVRMYPAGDTLALAAQLDALLGEPDALGSAKLAALSAARDTFCWEKQAPRLVQSVTDAIEERTGRAC